MPKKHSVPTPEERAQAASKRGADLSALLEIVDRLREPAGCPWDRKQTMVSMAPHLIEEAHELLEAIEVGDADEIAEEAGDVQMCLGLIARIGQEAGVFDLAQAARLSTEKLVRRHPHVFGETEVAGADEVLDNWEQIKKQERQDKQVDDSALAGIPKALPALQRVSRTASKAMSAGFRWPHARGAFDKVREEFGELEEALEGVDLDCKQPILDGPTAERVSAELGDLLMAGAFFARYLKLDPEQLCRQAIRRFEDRFRALEADVAGPLGDVGIEGLMAAWERAKGRGPGGSAS